MQYIVKKANIINGSIQLPASKSLSNRALILNAITGNKCKINNLAKCNDTETTIKALESYRKQNKDQESTEKKDNILTPIPYERITINIGAAGTAMRFLTAFFATRKSKIEITGSQRMKMRPIKILVKTLNKLGAEIIYSEKVNFPPLKINGDEIEGGKATIQGNVSSQYISAILMTACKTKNGVTLEILNELSSKPYLEMTLKMMEQFGIKYTREGNIITVKNQDTFPAISYTVESDWSAASYWYEIIALSSNDSQIHLKGLNKKSLQGDSKIATYFEQLGVKTTFTEDGVILSKTNTLCDKLKLDLTDQPDLAQTFAMTCAFKNIPFILKGLHTLKIKETDRIAALIKESKKLGYLFEEGENSSLIWQGNKIEKEENPIINTYQDHRMAMSFAPGALIFDSITIDNPEVVSKSYPKFWDNLKEKKFTIDKKE